jgi:hypothetical protein
MHHVHPPCFVGQAIGKLARAIRRPVINNQDLQRWVSAQQFACQAR